MCTYTIRDSLNASTSPTGQRACLSLSKQFDVSERCSSRHETQDFRTREGVPAALLLNPSFRVIAAARLNRTRPFYYSKHTFWPVGFQCFFSAWEYNRDQYSTTQFCEHGYQPNMFGLFYLYNCLPRQCSTFGSRKCKLSCIATRCDSARLGAIAFSCRRLCNCNSKRGDGDDCT